MNNWTNLTNFTRNEVLKTLERSRNILFPSSSKRAPRFIREHVSRIFPISNTFHFRPIRAWNTTFYFGSSFKGNGFSSRGGFYSRIPPHVRTTNGGGHAWWLRELLSRYHKAPSPSPPSFRFHFHGFRLQHAKVLFFFVLRYVPSVEMLEILAIRLNRFRFYLFPPPSPYISRFSVNRHTINSNLLRNIRLGQVGLGSSSSLTIVEYIPKLCIINFSKLGQNQSFWNVNVDITRSLFKNSPIETRPWSRWGRRNGCRSSQWLANFIVSYVGVSIFSVLPPGGPLLSRLNPG